MPSDSKRMSCPPLRKCSILTYSFFRGAYETRATAFSSAHLATFKYIYIYIYIKQQQQPHSPYYLSIGSGMVATSATQHDDININKLMSSDEFKRPMIVCLLSRRMRMRLAQENDVTGGTGNALSPFALSPGKMSPTCRSIGNRCCPPASQLLNPNFIRVRWVNRWRQRRRHRWRVDRARLTSQSSTADEELVFGERTPACERASERARIVGRERRLPKETRLNSLRASGERLDGNCARRRASRRLESSFVDRQSTDYTIRQCTALMECSFDGPACGLRPACGNLMADKLAI